MTAAHGTIYSSSTWVVSDDFTAGRPVCIGRNYPVMTVITRWCSLLILPLVIPVLLPGTLDYVYQVQTALLNLRTYVPVPVWYNMYSSLHTRGCSSVSAIAILFRQQFHPLKKEAKRGMSQRKET